MTVSINQPAYLPWLGYFDRIDASDMHIVLDHVQFEKNSFINRNKVLSANGGVWLTVPVNTKGNFNNLPIESLSINQSTKWFKKHLTSIRQYYSKSPFFKEYFEEIEEVFRRPWVLLSELIKCLNELFMRFLGITTDIVYSGTLEIQSKKSDLVLDLCRQVGADRYLSGSMGKDYLQTEQFEQSGIEVLFQDYQHPEYTQLHEGFTPYMSVLDLLFNHGKESINIIRSGRSYNKS